MAASYAWHPGAGGLSARCAVPVALSQDELLSSWLVRVALANGCDPLVLTGLLWPRWRVWARDPDRRLQCERLRSLGAFSGIDTALFGLATLYPWALRVAGRALPEQASWPWMLTLGVRNRRRRGGLQYCSACLREDERPYYRLQWRFAWHTVCARHGCLLRDLCGSCGAPVAPHRLLAEDREIALCADCKTDFRRVPSIACSVQSLAMQAAADKTVREGGGDCLGKRLSTPEWFGVFAFYVSLVRRAEGYRTQTMIRFLDSMGVSLSGYSTPAPGDGIESRPVAERQTLLDSAWLLLQATSRRMQKALEVSGLSRQGFCGDGPALPRSLAGVAGRLPDRSMARRRRVRRARPSGQRSRREIERMMGRLVGRLEAMRW